MIDPHHRTPAEADEGKQGGELGVVGPDIEDTDLSLGGPGGGVDDGLEGDALLEEVIGTVGCGDGGQLIIGGGELDAPAGK